MIDAPDSSMLWHPPVSPIAQSQISDFQSLPCIQYTVRHASVTAQQEEVRRVRTKICEMTPLWVCGAGSAA